MSVTTVQLFDGYGATRGQIGNPIFAYPFAQNGDVTSRTITRQYKQRREFYARLQLGTPDEQYGNMYLIFESIPVFTPTGLYSFYDIYANIPATQVTYSSRSISKPTVPNEAATTWTIYSLGGGAIGTAILNNTGFWASTDAVYAPFATKSAGNVPFASAGTFTLTYKASTTGALNYNDNIATIQAALNGLASVISDSLTFSGGNTVLTSNAAGAGCINLVISVGSTVTSVTMNPASLTVTSGTTNAFTQQVSSTAQTVMLGRKVDATAHGIAAATVPLYWANATTSAVVFAVGEWARVDANTLSVGSTGFDPTIQNASGYVAPFLRTYTAGVTQVSSRTTELFYLPGAPGQVATPASIPLEQTVISDNALIAAILAGGGYQTVAFDGPSFWRESSMYRTANTEVNLNDL